MAVLIGIMACGHCVAIDGDTSRKARAEMARCGYDIQTVEHEAGIKRFAADVEAHFRDCKVANAKAEG